MVARYLITTADERTWPKDQPVLFLGEWCQLFSRRKIWKSMDAVVAPYHWDDRKKIINDYELVQKVYEEQLKELRLKLNQIHGVDHSLRYWRILIGPWLGTFLQMLFDRWFMLKQVIEEGKVSICRILEREKNHGIPNDMGHFCELYFNDDWNEKIYGQLIDVCWNNRIKVEKINPEKKLDQKVEITKKNGKTNFKKFAKSVASNFYPLLTKENEYFFKASYFTFKSLLYLQMQLGQFPKLWPDVPFEIIKPDMQKRKWRAGSDLKEGIFSQVARKFIPLNIPTAYLEGYEQLVDKTENLPWPTKPKAIFTSNSFSWDDVFKAWAAEKTSKGIPMVIGQHGGHFGMTPWSFFEDHQITISDLWISWGWSDEKRPKVKPIGIFKEFGRNVKYDPNGDGLMFGMSLSRYSYYLYALPIASQWLFYFEDQCRFMNALPEILQQKILVRLFSKDYGNDQRERWQDKFPNVRTDMGHQPIIPVVEKSRLVISTYNSTTYLESFAWNVPTIIFWDPEYWELREEVKPFFDQLLSVGIFHKTPEDAAKHVASIWDDVESWWESGAVQNARRIFCENFSCLPEKPFEKLEACLKKIVKPDSR